MTNMTGIQEWTFRPHVTADEPIAPSLSLAATDAGVFHDDLAIAEAKIADTRTLEGSDQTTSQQIEAAVKELRTVMSGLFGDKRDVEIVFDQESQQFLIVIRNKETGEALQSFPPENLLNLYHRSADLLGMLIDRHS